MKLTVKDIQLIQQAQRGDKASMDALTHRVRPNLLAYIYRLTLDYDLTQDMLQETLLEMVKSLWRLRKIDRFWFWLCRTALGKVQHHYRSEERKRKIKMSVIENWRLSEHDQVDQNDGLTNLQRKELSDVVFKAIKKLKFKYRNVLTLRCYEQMQYTEIADMLGCTELQARVLFFRAKHSLKKQLFKSGFSRGLLLTALGLFGLLTTPAEAAATCTVTAASVKVGFVPALIGAATTKLGMFTAATITALTAYITAKYILILAGAVVVLAVLYFLFCLSLVEASRA